MVHARTYMYLTDNYRIYSIRDIRSYVRITKNVEIHTYVSRYMCSYIINLLCDSTVWYVNHYIRK